MTLYTIKERRATAGAWTTANPILQQGQWGVELGTGKAKLGDGTTHWADLPYFIDEDAVSEGLSTVWGMFPIYSEEAPVVHTMHGVPVIWFPANVELAPTPVDPTVPAWDDNDSTFQVPSVVGVIYKMGGITLQSGEDIDTTGTYPRHITVTAEPTPGYVFLSDAAFVHDFPDPAAVTILASDTFTAADNTTLVGRSTNSGLGGTAKAYTGLSAGTQQFRIMSNRLAYTASGSYDSSGANRVAKLAFTGLDNPKLEFDLISTSGDSIGNYGILVELEDAFSLWIGGGQCYRVSGLVTGASFAPAITGVSVAQTGHYVMQVVGETFTIILPDGIVHTVVLDGYDPPATMTVALNRGDDAAATAVIDNLVVSQMGS